ncbi:hypothetical protein [Streptomyces sp. NPDC007206]|uniref:hypothetical protein n=1 Tax=Streptomyces sp. NPDC007206 TaxID=3154317 RepID=UPI00340173AE
MSEQLAAPDDFRIWLTERGPDAHALAWVADRDDPTDRVGADRPTVGRTGIARTGADLTGITVHEVTHGRPETLRRWLQLDDGRRQLGHRRRRRPGLVRTHAGGTRRPADAPSGH